MYENRIEDIKKASLGDNDAMTKLIEDNQGLIWSIVKRFCGRGYETEDLYQIGCMGFIKSIKRFDTSFDVKLSTYAVPYILGEIKKFIRDDRNNKSKQKYKRIEYENKQTRRRTPKKNRRKHYIKRIRRKTKNR